MSMLDALMGLKKILHSGVEVTSRQKLNFIGDVSLEDDSANERTNITIESRTKWTVADRTARLALSVEAADVGKAAFQQDTEDTWTLVSVTPGVVWKPTGRRGFSSSREVVDDFTFDIGDAGGKVYVNKGTGVAATVPLSDTVRFDSFDVIVLIQKGAGAITLTPVSGSVTIVPPNGKTLVSNGVGAWITLTPDPQDLNTWHAAGDLV